MVTHQNYNTHTARLLNTDSNAHVMVNARYRDRPYILMKCLFSGKDLDTHNPPHNPPQHHTLHTVPHACVSFISNKM